MGFNGLLGLGSVLSALAGDIPGEPSLLQNQKILEGFGLYAFSGACEKMGNRTWGYSAWSFRGDENGLVEALA
jgi:hypothetical protein